MRKLYPLLLFVAIKSSSFGQSYFYDSKHYDADLLWEGGISYGIMNGATDVGERKGSGFSPAFYDWKSTLSNGSLYFAVLYRNMVEGRIELTRGKIQGYDANSNSAYIRSRNLSYRSNIYEASLTAAVHPLTLINADNIPVISPYLVGGVGVFSFYPKTMYNDRLIPLRWMNTEGEMSRQYPARQQYNLRAISFPVGFGAKYEISAKLSLRLEALARFTTTDYIDDASTVYLDRSIFPTAAQRILAHRYLELDPSIDRTGWARANPNNNDKFFTVNLKLGFVIGRQKIPVNYNPDPAEGGENAGAQFANKMEATRPTSGRSN